MHYYIDAYNVLFRSLHAGQDLEKERRSLIEGIESMAAHLGIHLTLIFDAASQVGPGSISQFRGMNIIFTEQGESADDRLIHCIKHEEHPQSVTLVTSDNRLAWRARCIGAKTESVESFLGWLRKSAEKRRKKTKRTSPPPSPRVQLQKIIPPKTEPTPSKQTRRIPKKTGPETIEDMDYYLDAFEKRLKQLEKEEEARKEEKRRQRRRKKSP